MKIPTNLHSRIRVILLLGPPALGAVLGGAMVHLTRVMFYGASREVPDVNISAAFAVISFVLLGATVARAIAVAKGSTTHFPKLWRVAPFTTLAGLVLGGLAAFVAQSGQ